MKIIKYSATIGELADALNEMIKEDSSVRDLKVLYYNDGNNTFDIVNGNFRKIKINEEELTDENNTIDFADVDNISEEDEKLNKTVILFE